MVADSVQTHRSLREIDNHVAGSPVARSRFADGARIDQIICVVTQRDLCLRQRHGTAFTEFIDAGVVGVAEGADARTGWVGHERLEAL